MTDRQQLAEIAARFRAALAPSPARHFTVLTGGAMPVPIDPRLTPEEAARQAERFARDAAALPELLRLARAGKKARNITARRPAAGPRRSAPAPRRAPAAPAAAPLRPALAIAPKATGPKPLTAAAIYRARAQGSSCGGCGGRSQASGSTLQLVAQADGSARLEPAAPYWKGLLS